MFNLLNKEFAFDADMSMIECGLNAAVYFVLMDKEIQLYSQLKIQSLLGGNGCGWMNQQVSDQ